MARRRRRASRARAARRFTTGWSARARWSGRRTSPIPSCGDEYARDIAPRTRGGAGARSWPRFLRRGAAAPDAGARSRAPGRARSGGRCARASAPALERRRRRPGRRARASSTANLGGRAAARSTGASTSSSPRTCWASSSSIARSTSASTRAPGASRAWARRCWRRAGRVILVEPALRETSRELLAVRDQLLALSELRVVAPCFWTGACPALARERDWCHDAAPVPSAPARRLQLPGAARPLAAAAGPAALPRRQRSAAREGPAEAVRLRPDRPPRLHPPRPPRSARRTPRSAKLVRGDVARIAGETEANDGMRVEATTAVAKRSPRVRRPPVAPRGRGVGVGAARARRCSRRGRRA